ncbi:MAG: hypothetical protein LBK42_08910 [Propionibacteriaceae bacterium]|jgi:uncharacterized protein YdhG (YjbR/CyaY superfamily)|nr:hypothetical protein [Propionibacteriaceae bacterium]
MDEFEAFWQAIPAPGHRAELESVWRWALETFPQVKPEFKWGKPTLTAHGTFIISFDAAKDHFSAVDPEEIGIAATADLLDQAGYSHTARIVRIPWGRADHDVLRKLIEAKLAAKADVRSFWLRGQAADTA